MSQAKENPFRLNGAIRGWRLDNLTRLAEGYAERLSGLRQLESIYEPQEETPCIRGFLGKTLDHLNVSHTAKCAALAKIPREGAAIVVANHLFGVLDGMLIAYLLSGVRKDFKILANRLLLRVPQLRSHLIVVDPYGGAGASASNRKPLREALSRLRSGGLLLAFPAGSISNWRAGKERSLDGPWSPSIAKIARLTDAALVPVFVDGSNSLGFYRAGWLHPGLRTFLIPRELANKRGQTVRLRIGKPMAYSRLRSLGGDEEIIQFLKRRTYMLRVGLQESGRRRSESAQGLEDLNRNGPENLSLCAEVGTLDDRHVLAAVGNLRVYYAHAENIPNIPREIGRLHELSFREVGEGTHKDLDLDIFDSYYLHLFIWDARAQCLVGAYRMGLVDDILQRFGRKGLYTYSLFKYKRSLLQGLDPAIELGHSFVRREYQKRFAPLMLLWKGIGAFVARHPRYRVLFGPVSISSDYLPASRQLLVSYLKQNSFEYDLARQVRPRRPFRPDLRSRWRRDDVAGIQDIEDLSELIGDLEVDGKSVPVLIKQYLKLGGRLPCFNVDKNYNALDGLTMVDLLATPTKILSRYMDPDQAKWYLD